MCVAPNVLIRAHLRNRDLPLARRGSRQYDFARATATIASRVPRLPSTTRTTTTESTRGKPRLRATASRAQKTRVPVRIACASVSRNAAARRPLGSITWSAVAVRRLLCVNESERIDKGGESREMARNDSTPYDEI